MAADPDVVRVSEKINEPLLDLTVGAHPQMSELALAEPHIRVDRPVAAGVVG